jgi:hypothetical protein
LAWRQFLGAEDIVRWNWTASLEDFRPRRSLVAAKPRHWKPLLTLFRREISLHQVSLLIACGILLFHLIDLGLRAFGGLSQGSDALFILEGAPLLWLSLPWIIGGTAVAEERRQGTLESELCLPVTRRRQFAVKLVVAVALGVFLGVIVPFAVEAIGMAFDINSTLFAGELRFWDRDNALVKLFTPIYGPIWARFEPAVFRVLLEFFYWVAVAVISSLLAFSCSTLARHTLQSLAATAILGASLALFVVWSLGQPILGTGALFLLIAGPVLLATLVRLGLRNYQTLMPEQRLWLRSVATIGIAALLVETATAFVYPRPWEWLFPPEPRPGPHRLQGSVVPLLCGGQERLLALLPDGRIWRATNYVKEVVITPGRDTWMFDRNEKWAPTNGEFLDGQWNDLVCFESNAVYALKSDGTLWSIWSLGGVLQFDQLGSDSDWRSIASGGRRMFGWKKDGSRWVWGISDEPRRAATGPDEIQRSARELADISLGPPTRRSDWIFITYFGDTLTALAADGAVCAWRDPPLTYHPYDYRNRGILAPSRRPAWCLNVLDTL